MSFGIEDDAECRAGPGDALDFEPITHRMTQRPADRKAEPTPLQPLGVINLAEGFEDLMNPFRGDTDACIRNVDPVRSQVDGIDSDSQRYSAFRSKFQSIIDQIYQNLL